ncbi:MAG: hypothetical protein AUG05_04240 [Actinobacteria bacterium 13_1_20CM_2_66_18]|nr:MAG: hypothetical protein AUG05_04240 [Actinobacteria bacterium 13_1_20CM_2_66_18]
MDNRAATTASFARDAMSSNVTLNVPPVPMPRSIAQMSASWPGAINTPSRPAIVRTAVQATANCGLPNRFATSGATKFPRMPTAVITASTAPAAVGLAPRSR